MEKNQTLKLSIEEVNNLGYGVAHGEDGRVVFVANAVTGDEVEASVIKVAKSYAVAKTTTVLTPSPYRIENDCPAHSCGGCVYRHLTYDYEKTLKRNAVQTAFAKVGLNDVTVNPVVSDDVTSRYRNKACYPVANVGGRMVAGFYAANSHRVVPCKDCTLQPPVFAEVLSTVLDFCNAHGVTAYDEQTKKGALRHVYLRQGAVGGELMVCLVVTDKNLPDEGALVGLLVGRFPSLTCLCYNFNKDDTNVILGDKFKVIYGEKHITDTLCGRRFEITPASFYQVNHAMCETLYAIAREKANLTGDETLLDLYCGMGSIGLSMADKVKRIIGVEVEPSAVEHAKKNAKINGFTNAEYYCGDASDSDAFLSASEVNGKIENPVVILDPPRKGTTEALMDAIARRGYDRIVYVSCNPETLARDCLYFKTLGYDLGDVTPVDMFPRTGHVESVVALTKKRDK